MERTRSGCGRPGCACELPLGERFVLWRCDNANTIGALPTQG